MTTVRPLRRGDPRPSALSGRWYPGDPDALGSSVRAHITPPERPLPLQSVTAIVTPHAGHIYSGPIAGKAFGAVAGGGYRRVVLVGPAHRVGFEGISAGDFERYQIPTADFPVDRPAVAQLEAAGLVSCYPSAHAEEHCLEILLPFIIEALGVLPIVPLLVGRTTPDAVAAALDATLTPDDLLVVSSDLSHFHPYATACSRDARTLDAIIAGHGELLDGHDACGYRGVQGALAVAAERGWARVLLGYQNSGDTAGDASSVVGYGAVALGTAA